jgi:hypothetical protein
VTDSERAFLGRFAPTVPAWFCSHGNGIDYRCSAERHSLILLGKPDDGEDDKLYRALACSIRVEDEHGVYVACRCCGVAL